MLSADWQGSEPLPYISGGGGATATPKNCQTEA